MMSTCKGLRGQSFCAYGIRHEHERHIDDTCCKRVCEHAGKWQPIINGSIAEKFVMRGRETPTTNVFFL